MLSDKISVRNLVQACHDAGVTDVIISPGSRNAPLIISFNGHGGFNCLSIPDERVAGFFGLGMAQQTGNPVILVCTSGTAVLNYAPAICEAYYQRIPLLVISADRPSNRVDQGESQTINQFEVFRNYTKGYFGLHEDDKKQTTLKYNNRLVCEALDLLGQPSPGPVHINIPFSEPLYNRSRISSKPTTALPEILQPEKKISADSLRKLRSVWEKEPKKLIFCGLMPPDPELNELLHQIASDPSVVILTETTANQNSHRFITCVDRVISTFNETSKSIYKPELLITIGNCVISKMFRAWLREFQPKHHWHIDAGQPMQDTYDSQTLAIKADPKEILKTFKKRMPTSNSHYSGLWGGKNARIWKRHTSYLLNDCPWSDLKVFDLLLPLIPENSVLQMGNSTVVRYIQLFDQRADIVYNSNRGVSGIDGCTSTATGAAWSSSKRVTLITGDVAFLYDSNAFWHNQLNANLRIILINNGGGGIFRFLDGPERSGLLDTYFETQHNVSVKHICQAFDINHDVVHNEEELNHALELFYEPTENERPAVLEIFTPREENAVILKQYFDVLKKKR
jgi:2-succinyl-5-enolpyruvyl-6-hydroxy-3-cyclohexene-1-carboxylate synthase